MEHLDTISDLIAKHFKGTLTSSEQSVLQHWIDESPDHAAILETIREGGALPYVTQLYGYRKSNNPLRQKIAAILPEFSPEVDTVDMPAIRRISLFRTTWFRYAAILLLLAGTATMFYLEKETQTEVVKVKTNAHSLDILPGGNKATLTLADGTMILLDSVADGALARQGNTQVLKLDGGKLAYHGATGGEVLYNTINTPKGGQYQVELPDGSKVWLNAASSIRFPTTFEKERTVEITGESYFEVVADKSKPFQVKTGSVNIHVIGTGFNVNAYAEEGGVKVSLSQGSVKVGETILKPGEALKDGKVSNTDLQQDLAWKNGIFDFRGQGVAEVMRQLERWYSIEVVYQGGIPDVRFAGKSSKGVSLNGMLKGLQETGVHCTLEGRRLIVMP